MKFIKNTLLLCAVFIYANSCKKFVDIPDPVNQIVSNTAFADDKTAIATLNGMYGKMMASASTITSGAATFYPGMSADEFTNYTPGTKDNFSQNTLGIINDTELDYYLWSSAYTFIYAANSCIEGAAESKTISEDVRNQVTGEALFVRAWMHFQLTNLFGPIPLITSSDYNINKSKERADTVTVYNQIVADLTKAEILLKTDYPTTGHTRPNRYVVEALLAKVSLYRRDYSNAIKYCNAILANSAFIMLADLNSVFLANSAEAIWQLVPVSTSYNTYEGNQFVPASSASVPNYVVTTSFLNDFEAGDKRKVSWLASRVYKSQTVYYPYKYKVRASTTYSEYCMVFRLPEIYLISSEAKAQSGDLAGATADVNVIRKRAGLTELGSTLTQQQLLDTIIHERRIELFAEWGNRWLDLKRTGRVNKVIGGLKPTWKPTAALYPVPSTQIKLNTALKQNDGY